MEPSSRTPEGQPIRCPICNNEVRLEPTVPPGDAPCPHCGSLLWFSDPTKPVALASEQALGSAHFSHLSEMVESGELSDHIVSLIPSSVARENRVVPVYETRSALVVATAQPIAAETTDKFRFILNRPILVFPTSDARVQKLLDKYFAH